MDCVRRRRRRRLPKRRRRLTLIEFDFINSLIPWEVFGLSNSTQLKKKISRFFFPLHIFSSSEIKKLDRLKKIEKSSLITKISKSKTTVI